MYVYVYTRLGDGYRARSSACTHRNVAENGEWGAAKRQTFGQRRVDTAHTYRERRVHRGVVRPPKHSLNSTRAAESIREPSPARSLSLSLSLPAALEPTAPLPLSISVPFQTIAFSFLPTFQPPLLATRLPPRRCFDATSPPSPSTNLVTRTFKKIPASLAPFVRISSIFRAWRAQTWREITSGLFLEIIGSWNRVFFFLFFLFLVIYIYSDCHKERRIDSDFFFRIKFK